MTVVKNNDFEQSQGPGGVFIQARQALSITQAETADVLNLSVNVIIALESNDDSVLPERAYVNGYIRSYAKLLGLAAEPLIQSWGAQFPDEMQSQRADLDEKQARNWSVASSSPRETTGLVRWVAVAFVLSVVFVYFVSNQEPTKSLPEVALVGNLAIESEVLPDWDESLKQDAALKGELVEGSILDEMVAGETVAEQAVLEDELLEKAPLDLAQSTTEIESGTVLIGEEAVVVEAKTSVIIIRPEPEPEPEVLGNVKIETPSVSDASTNNLANNVSADLLVVIEEPTRAKNEIETTMSPVNDAGIEDADDMADSTDALDYSLQTALVESGTIPPKLGFKLPRLTLEGNDRLVLAFTEDCWFEIKDINGEMLHADLGRSEQVREYFGQGPFSIKLGFAQGATIKFNGNSIALEPYTRNNVAKLVLGQ